MSSVDSEHIAIIGLAGRFPGADNVGEFWQNLVGGVESIAFFSDDELRASGVPEADIANPNYVKAAPIVNDGDKFDPNFFGMTMREGEVLDPQHRMFMEACEGALQHAGYDYLAYPDRIGVYGGQGVNSYFDDYVLKNPDAVQAVGKLATNIANIADYLSTGVAFRLGLRGPAFTNLSACSTSMVSVHLACQALRTGDCEMALAGGVEEFIPAVTGYYYSEGGLYSPDGHCRTFDAKARGTIFGSGSAAVLLKRLDKALEDGDNVLAIIRGTAINNDGSDKGAFTAPSISGQLAAVTAAIRRANVDPATISYVEAHGTSTFVGDPIEVNSLTQAFRLHTDRRQYCGIGSVKTNVGHLGAAAGVTGLIKTVLAMQNRILPPSINYDEPNPQIDFENSPFYVNTELTPWKSDTGPLRASVSSFGVGGTNAHCVVEEAPPRPAPVDSPRSHQIVLLSAHTPTALEKSATDLGEHLSERPDEFADAAYTLAVGRPQRQVRSFLVARDAGEAADRLAAGVPMPQPGIVPGRSTKRTIAFVFPGQGSQYAGMGKDLYDAEPVFRAEIDACAEVLPGLRELLFSDDSDKLTQTRYTQPALFAVEYAMARLAQSWGLDADAMVGHSIGEYVAATLAGVFSRDDALRLVAARGALMQELPAGSMLAVPVSAELLEPMLFEGLDLAAVNAPDLCVVSGPSDLVAEFAESIAMQGLTGRPLHTSHAFHSAMMDPILERFTELVAGVERNEPTIPFVSNLTGDWITAEQATDPSYWARHLRGAVRFADAVKLLTEGSKRVLVELGPGQTLTTLARRQVPADKHGLVVPTMRHPQQRQNDVAVLLTALGQVWQAGGPIDTSARFEGEERYRIALPPVPYERQRCWLEPQESDDAGADATVTTETGPYYIPVWRETALATPGEVDTDAVWVVFEHKAGTAVGEVAAGLRAAGARVVTVTPGAEPGGEGDAFTVRPREIADYQAIFRSALAERPERLKLVHGWLVDEIPGDTPREHARAGLDLGFFAILAAAQAVSRDPAMPPLDVYLLTANARDVAGGEFVDPVKAGVDGFVTTLPKEFSATTCRSIDLAGGDPKTVGAQALREITGTDTDAMVAYRGRKRWVRTHQESALASVGAGARYFKDRGVYVITGGLGGIGLRTAKDLAERHQARMVLLGRSALPARDQWADYLTVNPADDPISEKIAALQEVLALGGELIVLSADVTDVEQLREVKRRAEEEWGTVDGVLHAAGITGGGMLEARTFDECETVMKAKVFGTLAIAEVFDDIETLILYSTFAVWTGDFGLFDYGSANAIMDAFAHSRASGRTHVVSVNWPIWKRLGMAYNIDAPDALTNFEMGDRYEKVDHPLLGSKLTRIGNTSVTFVKRVSAEDWVTDEHRLLGWPCMPGTSLVEICRAAYEHLSGSPTCEVRNIVFIRPVAYLESGTIHIVLTPTGDGSYDVVIADAEDNQPFTTATVGAAPGDAAPTHDVAAWRARCPIESPAVGLLTQGVVTLGPRWESIERHWSSEDDAKGICDELVLLSLPEQFSSDLDDYKLHPALMDNANALGQTLKVENPNHLPFGYDRVVVRSALPARFYSFIRHLDDTTGSMIRSDITLADEDGVEIVSIKGFTMVELDERPAEAPDGAEVVEAEVDNDSVAGSLTWDLVRANDREFGIDPDDGYDMLFHILDSGTTPQVMVCPDSMTRRIRLAAEVTRDALREQLTAAPTLSSSSVTPRNLMTPYVEPESDVQRVLCAMLADSLGIDKVGIEDDFFDLNGNSLIAVQLVARVREKFQVDLTVAALFEARTPRNLAEAVGGLLLDLLSDLSDDEAAARLAALTK